MEHVPGRIFKDPGLEGMSPEDRRSIYLSICDVLVKIHKVNIKEAGLEDYGKQGWFIFKAVFSFVNMSHYEKFGESSGLGSIGHFLIFFGVFDLLLMSIISLSMIVGLSSSSSVWPFLGYNAWVDK